jgi:hypothetical protein
MFSNRALADRILKGEFLTEELTGSTDLMLGPYRILSTLGRGAQAEVFLAED